MLFGPLLIYAVMAFMGLVNKPILPPPTATSRPKTPSQTRESLLLLIDQQTWQTWAIQDTNPKERQKKKEAK